MDLDTIKHDFEYERGHGFLVTIRPKKNFDVTEIQEALSICDRKSTYYVAGLECRDDDERRHMHIFIRTIQCYKDKGNVESFFRKIFRDRPKSEWYEHGIDVKSLDKKRQSIVDYVSSISYCVKTFDLDEELAEGYAYCRISREAIKQCSDYYDSVVKNQRCQKKILTIGRYGTKRKLDAFEGDTYYEKTLDALEKGVDCTFLPSKIYFATLDNEIDDVIKRAIFNLFSKKKLDEEWYQSIYGSPSKKRRKILRLMRLDAASEPL